MKLRVLAIDLPPSASDPLARFAARVKLDIDGQHEWFDCTVSPLGMPGSDVRVIEASAELVGRFRDTPTAIHHVRALVGQAVSQGGVHLPQLIAA